MWGKIRILAMDCAPILHRSKDDGKIVVETSSDELVMGAEQVLHGFSPRISQQNHSDHSLKALDGAFKHFYQMNGAFRVQKRLKRATANVD